MLIPGFRIYGYTSFESPQHQNIYAGHVVNDLKIIIHWQDRRSEGEKRYTHD